jgi:hypothetical protein
MTRGDKPSERRRAERVPVNAEFTEAATTYVSDLSQTGVFVHTAQELPVGTPISLRFTVLLDDPVAIIARGKVVRHQADPPGLGIAFVELSPEMVMRIDDVVSHRRPHDLGPPLPKADGSQPALDASTQAAALARMKLKRRGAAPAPDAEGTKMVPAPKPEPTLAGAQATKLDPSHPAFEDSKTLMKLEAVDVEIVDEDADPASSRPGGAP